jgi:hypothetical protein
MQDWWSTLITGEDWSIDRPLPEGMPATAAVRSPFEPAGGHRTPYSAARARSSSSPVFEPDSESAG